MQGGISFEITPENEDPWSGSSGSRSLELRMTNETFADGHGTPPDDDQMRLYARAYATQKTADEIFLRWEACHADALQLDQAPDRFHGDYGLNGRQLAEGARIAARRMALVLAEAPTELRAVLALKIHAYESMAQLDGEGTRSNAIFMVEAAMKADAERLDIVLMPLPHPPRQAQ
ncbi:hypothetical protein [Bosea sp. (in: a-proteobacteria)]|uniref:hypothetical protein n=1 Tax=Bosea sp. (in: a-proteobacteria) TaxID=1871050 RepID=UPI002DDD2DD1|nr:hypothetical protein [Bosea sp. (in: a-proteobacteria)]